MTWRNSNTKLTKETHHAFYGREWCLGLDHYNFLKPFLNNVRFLDIGCGAMRTGIHIAREVSAYVGVDGHKEALDSALNYEIPMNHLNDKNIKLIHDTKFNYVSMRPFDVIFCFSVIQHLNSNDVKECINMIAKNSGNDTIFITNNQHELLDTVFNNITHHKQQSELLDTVNNYYIYTK